MLALAGLHDADAVQRTDLAAIERATGVTVVGRIEPVGVTHEVTGNTVETTSTLGVSFNNVDGLLIDGNNCTHTDKVWGKYPSIRVTNSPNWTVTNNVAHTFILPSGTWIMKPAPGNACPVYA